MKTLLFLFLAVGCSIDAKGFGGVDFDAGVLARSDAKADDGGGGGGGGSSALVPDGSVGGVGGGGGATATGSGGAITSSGGSASGGTSGAGGNTAITVGGCFRPGFWDLVNDEKMRPGSACNTCHNTFTVSGTVFDRSTEPENCPGVDSTAGAQVTILDAAQHTITLPLNAVGNFWTSAVVVFPATVSVVRADRLRIEMQAQVTLPKGGDCNSCHGVSAPGRIVPP